GQAFRHKPQCTQRSRSNCLGPKSVFSDKTVKSATVQQVPRIKQMLDPLHDFKIAARGRPEVAGPPAPLWRKLDHCLADGPWRAAQPLRGSLRPLEITIADAGARARHRRTGERLHNWFDVLQRTRGAHQGAIVVRRLKHGREVFHAAPERPLALILESLAIGEVGEVT